MDAEKINQKNKSEAFGKKESAEANSDETPGLSTLFSDLTDVMDIAMWEIDLDYRVIAFNKKAKMVYGEDVRGDFCYAIAAKFTILTERPGMSAPRSQTCSGGHSNR